MNKTSVYLVSLKQLDVLEGLTPSNLPSPGGSKTPISHKNDTSAPAKCHLNPSNSISRAHKHDRQTTDKPRYKEMRSNKQNHLHCTNYVQKQLDCLACLSHRNSVLSVCHTGGSVRSARIIKSSPSAAWKTLVS